MVVDSSIILIASSMNTTLNEILPNLPKHNTRIIKNEIDGKDEFTQQESKKAIKEAYLATSEKKYIILCGTTFRIEAQNSLLKILEEPPSNIIFIIITQSKSAILPTIFSRIPHKIIKSKSTLNMVELDLNKLDLKEIHTFLKQYQRISKDEAKELIQSLLYTAKVQNKTLNQHQLDAFSNGLKLINLNSRPINIITNIMLLISLRFEMNT
jgi:DNA polymerase-3 subunit delta'